MYVIVKTCGEITVSFKNAYSIKYAIMKTFHYIYSSNHANKALCPRVQKCISIFKISNPNNHLHHATRTADDLIGEIVEHSIQKPLKLNAIFPFLAIEAAPSATHFLTQTTGITTSNETDSLISVAKTRKRLIWSIP